MFNPIDNTLLIDIFLPNTTMKPYLAQQETNLTARENWLQKNREDYQFDHNFLAPIPNKPTN